MVMYIRISEIKRNKKLKIVIAKQYGYKTQFRDIRQAVPPFTVNAVEMYVERFIRLEKKSKHLDESFSEPWTL